MRTAGEKVNCVKYISIFTLLFFMDERFKLSSMTNLKNKLKNL